jgi:hypothetical protein
MVTMHEFLTSGSLGEVMLGSTVNQVESVLGPPEHRSVRRDPLILRYGSLQLTFHRVDPNVDSKLMAMAMYFGDCKRSLPTAVQPTDWLPSCGATEEEFRDFLSSAGIGLHSTVTGQKMHFVLSSGNHVVFVDGKLDSIHIKRAGAERKQLSVSLPAEVVELLRERAREEKMSVQQVVEKLIVEGTRTGG